LSKNQILKVLFPEYEQLVDEVMQKKEKEIQEEMKKDTGDSDDSMARY
jgi:hypothetical protein